MPTVGVIGVGTMGAGIAQIAAQAGWNVLLRDATTEAAQKGLANIRAQFRKLADKGKLDPAAAENASQRVALAAAAADFAPCDLIIEAVLEDLELKMRLLGEAAHAAPAALLASNTSSLSISKLARGIGQPARTIGMHFFNPVPLMQLVEVIQGLPESAPACERVLKIARDWGKTPVRCADHPGFIVNRVARGYYLEPLRMLVEGVASVEELDKTLTTAAGFRMGPFALMDLIGIDVNYAVSCSVWEQLGRPARLKPSEVQERLVKAGCFGRKTGRGAYDYSREHALAALPFERRSFALPEEIDAAVRRFAAAAGVANGSQTEQYICARTLAAICNEAALALDDNVATEADIDTAMKLGTNYPHGPIEWARRAGVNTTRHLLEKLNTAAPDGRFAPARWWTSAG